MRRILLGLVLTFISPQVAPGQTESNPTFTDSRLGTLLSPAVSNIELPKQQDEEISINLADQQNVDLGAFLRLLAQTRNMKILDDGRLAGKSNQVQFFGKTVVNSDTLFELVQGVLRSNGLAIVQADVNGWHRVVELANVRPYAQQGDPNDFQRAEYITGVYRLSHIAPEEAESYIKQLVYGGTNQSNNSITLLPSRKTLIVTETASRLRSISRLIQQIDQPREEELTKIYKVQNVEVTELESQLRELLNLTNDVVVTNDSSSGNTRNSNRTPQSVQAKRLRLVADVRTNRLILFGTADQISEAMKSIGIIDVKLDIEFKRYQFTHVSASRIDELVKQSLGGVDESLLEKIYKSSINEQANELLVTARQEIHDRVDELASDLDKPTKISKVNNPVQFYTLKNVQAVDILDTLQSIVRRVRGNEDPRRLNGINARDGFGVNGPNNFPGSLGGIGTTPPFQQDDLLQGGGFNGLARSSFQEGDNLQNDLGITQSPASNFSDFVSGLGQAQASLRQSGNIIPGEARITVDENSNTLIVVAEPAVQQLYADLIERLDRRPPQVLIEVMFITINANEDFQFGVQVSGGDRQGDKRLFAFSQFGLANLDATNGLISQIAPGTGFNGTLIDPDIADLVVRALYTNDRARVVTAPKILVNDNSTGVTSSVVEQPFTSLNNAGDTISSTSFGGFVEAGTTISVTPQISDDDYLNLEFDILLNSFTNTVDAGSTVPPPRATNQVTSQVAIPDGHTVIVGGLTTKSLSRSYSGIPWLERVPILRSLAGNQIEDEDETNIFVFIKPTILRDDKFRDLQFISELDRRKSCIPNDAPSSEPLLIR
ncbi:MAG: secretin N-terminal domain-containing protein [Planctomycetota bacterium]